MHPLDTRLKLYLATCQLSITVTLSMMQCGAQKYPKFLPILFKNACLGHLNSAFARSKTMLSVSIIYPLTL